MVSEERSQAGHQAIRLRRSLVAVAGCSAFVLAAWIARDQGLLHLSAVAFWLLAAPWLLGSLLFAAVIRADRNLAFADPAMTLAQILWAACGPILMFPFMPQLAVMTYAALLVIALFGAFRLVTAQYLSVNALLAAGAGLGLLLQRLMVADDSAMIATVIAFASFVFALGIVTFVGSELAGMRRKLTRRNDELTLAFDRLREMAIRDELTGIHNRRFLMDALHQQKAQADRRQDHGFAICFVDLDHFKRVNDVFGHAKGDMVLRRFADIARKAIRDVDYVARLGGEEFVLVLVGSSSANACIVADRIRAQMAGLTVSDLIPDFRISASFGITEYRRGEDIDRTMSRADGALYEAKSSGRNQVIIAKDAEDTANPATAGGEAGIEDRQVPEPLDNMPHGGAA